MECELGGGRAPNRARTRSTSAEVHSLSRESPLSYLFTNFRTFIRKSAP
jgi:hypothetical protein